MGKLVVTKVGRMSFASLFTPKANDSGGEPKYEATLIFPAGTDLSDIEKEIDRAATAAWGDKKPAMLKKMRSYPIKSNENATDREGDRRGGYEDDKGFHVQFKSTSKPKVVGREKDPVTGSLLELTKDEIWSGCWVRGSFSSFAGIHDEGGPYVYMGLSNIQLIKKDEAFGAGPSNPDEDFADDEAVMAALAD